MFKFVTICFSIFLLSLGPSQAASQKYVYRADDQGPGVTFNRGFQTWGNNINVALHIRGYSTSTGSRNSAFISTTTQSSFAYTFMRQRIQPGQVYYVYQIRADENFYSALRTMNHLAQRWNTRVDPLLINTLLRENEYIAYNGIPADHIESVTTYRLNASTGELENLGSSSNSRYVNANTGTNENPFTLSDQYPYVMRPILFATNTNDSAEFESNDETGAWCLPSIVSLFQSNHTSPQ
ncbi:Pertussis toxin subunit 1 [Commensalibacter sp. Nvir]|uniref:scabin-related ADP-ribosyltransferase n=1 Tax=Commensalibacter sp. Nvir TaxID=3069817 RepID=UPI002D372CF1|nr:Pertussis toxin subunit 1 [Commensalibacter sp. Nvir]